MSFRTCCSCKAKKAKHDLLRFVWAENKVMADPDQKMPGRGVYCCSDERCLSRFLGMSKKWKRLFRL
ncbi:YlxR family protein [Desulforhopalus singaporensis]|uniref:YlxR family protein n=1 Tax=Desulforhopalus singaporensis TaxID=91360 RepID=UPI0038B3E02C